MDWLTPNSWESKSVVYTLITQVCESLGKLRHPSWCSIVPRNMPQSTTNWHPQMQKRSGINIGNYRMCHNLRIGYQALDTKLHFFARFGAPPQILQGGNRLHFLARLGAHP